MAATGPPPRRRPRRGSIERPVSGRIYRGTWLLVGLPLLIAAFSVSRPAPLAPPALPAAFDEQTAAGLADELASSYPDRSPGSAGALGAAQWLVRQLKAFNLTTAVDSYEADDRGRRPAEAAERRCGRLRPVVGHDRRDGPPRRQRRGPRRQRQRVRDRGADRARARLRRRPPQPVPPPP